MNKDSLQILLVEDSPTDAQLFRHVFLRSSVGDWSLEAVECLADAIASCQSKSFDLALLDLQLPDSDGLDTVSQFNQAVPDVPIIILTAFDDEELALQAMSKGAQDYLVKDQVTTQLLRRSIRYTLERSQIIKQLRKSEQVMLEAFNKEKELNQLKSYFVSMVSHEFRNPLNILQMLVGLIIESEGKLTEEKKELYTYRLESTIKNMCDLLDEVILLGKADTGNFELDISSLELQDFCDQLIDVLKLNNQNQNPITISYDLAIKKVSVDVNLLRHIFNNLILNSFKYSPLGSEVKVEVTVFDNKLILTVRDRGIGISEADQLLLFKPFSRGSNVGKIRGSGLGLAIVKRCVDLWGGEVILESQVDIGSTFTVTLPV